MFAGKGEVEMNGVLVKTGGEWTFQFEMDDGLIVRADQRWSNQEEAHKFMCAYVEQVGGRCNSKN